MLLLMSQSYSSCNHSLGGVLPLLQDMPWALSRKGSWLSMLRTVTQWELISSLWFWSLWGGWAQDLIHIMKAIGRLQAQCLGSLSLEAIHHLAQKNPFLFVEEMPPFGLPVCNHIQPVLTAFCEPLDSFFVYSCFVNIGL